MSSTTANNRSPEPSSPPKFKKYYKGFNKKVPKAKSGRPFYQRYYHERPNNDYPKDNELLHRLSLPSPSPPRTLLERIGGSVEDEATSTLTDSDPIIDGERVSQGDNYAGVPFSPTHIYTPEPGEVERFLESVIAAAPTQSLPGATCQGNKPALALETHDLPVDHRVKVEDSTSSVLYSPTQTAVNSLPSATHPLDYLVQQSLLPSDTMSPPSASAIEECRKHLVPVLLAFAQARDPGKPLHAEQCHSLLSDDRCKSFIQKAKEMRFQLLSLISQKPPLYQGWSRSLKRDRADEVDAWVRNTRSRFDSVNTVVSDVSRKDSDITLVDFMAAGLPPTAPRAMLPSSQASLITKPEGTQGQAPSQPLQVASPTTEDRPTGSTLLFEIAQQAANMSSGLTPASQPAVENIDTCAGQLGGDQSSPTQPTPSSSTDFVSHLPTQSGIWFKQLGRQYAEIVDIDIEVSDEMFYMSKERLPFGMRMHLRLYSVPVDAMTANEYTDPLTSLQDVNGAVERHALHWPKKGKLIVQVNPESERSKTWLPHTLESDPLDVTSCMRPGRNTFRFIQLSDLSEFTFVLVASPPPSEEEWRGWDWSSLLWRSRTRSDDPANRLSEFAHLPVIVRS